MEFHYQDASLVARQTPWDQNALSLSSIEITEIKGHNTHHLSRLLEDFEAFCVNDKLKYTNIKISSQDRHLTLLLQKEGYQFVDSSLNVYRSAHIAPLFQGQNLLLKKFDLIPFQTSHLPELERIATTAFRYGRIAEDARFENHINELRNLNWIRDLTLSGPCLVMQTKGRVTGFMAYQIKNSICSFVLGGVDYKFEHLALAFWESVIEKVKAENLVNAFETTISTANIGVLNLYIKLAFHVTGTFWGFSKIRK